MFDISKYIKKLPELQMDEAKRKTLLVYVLALAVILLFYFFVFLKPSISKLAAVIPKVREYRIQIKEVREDLLFESKLKEKFEAAQVKMGKYEKKLSREKEIPLLLENLSGMAKTCRVKIIAITPIGRKRMLAASDDGKGGVYEEVPIAVSAQSGYHDLGAFINKLETGERYMQVSDIKIRSNKANPKRHNVDFVVYAYMFKKD